MKYVTHYALVALLFVCAVSAADPDFTGIWSLNESESDQRRLPDRPWKQMRVELKDTEIRCLPVEPAAEPKAADKLLMSFATDGRQTVHAAGGGSGKSIAKWEGAALLINTIVTTPSRNYTQMDRWKLSRDGKVLTVRRQIVTLHGETESFLIYEKQ